MPLGRAQQLCKLIKYVAVEHRQQQLQRRYERGRERYVFPDLSSSWAQYAGMEMRTLAGGKLARGMRWMPSAPAGHASASYEGPAALACPPATSTHRSLIFATMAKGSGDSATTDAPRAEDYIQTASQCYGACICVYLCLSASTFFEILHSASHSSRTESPFVRS